MKPQEQDPFIDTQNLVDSYLERVRGSKSAALDNLLSDFWRNYPRWPSTFNPCPRQCGGYGRGCLPCADCLQKAIGLLTENPKLVADFKSAMVRVFDLEDKIKDTVSS